MARPARGRAARRTFRRGTPRPAGTTYDGSGASSSAGVITETWWPEAMSASARSRTCCWTPPGTSQVYGQTSPTLIVASPVVVSQILQPHPLKHVPVLGMRGDPRLELPGEPLRHRADLAVPIALVGHGDLLVDARSPVVPFVPQGDWKQGRTGLDGQRRGDAGHTSGLTEEIDINP